MRIILIEITVCILLAQNLFSYLNLQIVVLINLGMLVTENF